MVGIGELGSWEVEGSDLIGVEVRAISGLGGVKGHELYNTDLQENPEGKR